MPAPDRATPADCTVLAADRPGGAPQQIGVLLMLDTAAGADRARRTLIERIPTVARLRQRLRTLPPGLGRPVWVDDPTFDAGHHVAVRHLDGPLDEPMLLQAATELITRPLPRTRPLWSATVITDPTDRRIGIVLVLHHAIADGIGGLTVLDQLLDGPSHPPVDGFPRPRPAAAQLAADAARSGLHAITRLPAVFDELRRASAASGGTRRAQACSLLRPTRPQRRLTTATANLEALRVAGHQHGATINDVLLAAVAGALAALLTHRGEGLDTVRTAVIVGSPRRAAGAGPGNMTAPLIVDVPAGGSLPQRLARLAGTVRSARAATAGGAVEVLQPLFRAMAKLGLYRLYMCHQHRMHTVVSNVHGPDRQRSLAGMPVRRMVPLSVSESGNLAVQFVALSYAGQLTITAVADPHAVPDLDVLTRALQAELDATRVLAG